MTSNWRPHQPCLHTTLGLSLFDPFFRVNGDTHHRKMNTVHIYILLLHLKNKRLTKYILHICIFFIYAIQRKNVYGFFHSVAIHCIVQNNSSNNNNLIKMCSECLSLNEVWILGHSINPKCFFFLESPNEGVESWGLQEWWVSVSVHKSSCCVFGEVWMQMWWKEEDPLL